MLVAPNQSIELYLELIRFALTDNRRTCHVSPPRNDRISEVSKYLTRLSALTLEQGDEVDLDLGLDWNCLDLD